MTRATWMMIAVAALASSATLVSAADAGAGTPCVSPSECASGNCVDGVCCNTSACGDCASCDHPAHRGQCFRRDPGYPSPGCAAGYVCNGIDSDCKRDCSAGVCAAGYYCSEDVTPVCRAKLALNAPCTTVCPDGGTCDACESGHCVDGVCCDARCDGACVACTRALKGQGDDGVCGDVLLDRPGRQRCAHEPPNSCMYTGLCDGKGACALHAPGTKCGRNLCVKDIRVDLECDGQGQCAPHISQACRGDCAADAGCTQLTCPPGADCDAGSRCAGHTCDAGTCDGGACARRPTAPCANDSECTAPLRCDFEGRCVDPDALTESPSPCAIGRAGPGRELPAAWALLGLAALAFFARRLRDAQNA